MPTEPQEPTYKLPVKPLLNPLTEQDRIAIEQIINQLPTIEDLINRAEQVGLNMDQHRERHEMHKVISQRLHTHFFPNELPAVSE